MGLRETLVRLREPDLSGDPAVAAAFDAAASALLDMAEGWLDPLRDAGVVAVARSTAALEETGYRPRPMPGLRILAGGREVLVRPVAAQVAGARGRVDMTSDADGVPGLMILLDPMGRTGWRARWRDEHGLAPLDREAFLSALSRLSGPSADTGGDAIASFRPGRESARVGPGTGSHDLRGRAHRLRDRPHLRRGRSLRGAGRGHHRP